MKLSREKQAYVENIADEALTTFQRVSAAARKFLRQPPSAPENVFATINTLNSGGAMRQFDQVSEEIRRAYATLSREPAVARVRVQDDRGEMRTIYICRSTPIGDAHQFVSYRAPLGSLASLRIGGHLTVPSGKRYQLVEKALVHPAELKEGWDSHDTILSSETIRTLTIESLRAILGEHAAVPEEDLLGQLLATEQLEMNLVEGIRRRVITKMELRDQPVLDQFQDQIFRLSLSKQLLLLGPPGTGKTTTLIRRLGQKLDSSFLDEDEKELIRSIERLSSTSHMNSWLMFTPTELLKQYLKEAFAKEGIAASDQRIRTWHDVRYDLARNVFGVLRTATGSGSFVMKELVTSIKEDAISSSVHWFEDFDTWQRTAYLDQLRTSSEILKDTSDPAIGRLGARLHAISEGARRDGLTSGFTNISLAAEGARAILTQLRQKSDETLRAELNRQLNKNREFLNELFEIVNDQRGSETEEEQDELEAADEDESPRSKTDVAVAMNAYMASVRALARSLISQNRPRKSSLAGRVISWLGSRILDEYDLRELGGNLILQAHLRAFLNPVKRYLDGIPARYRAFRRIRREEGAWYTRNPLASAEVHPLEIDLVLLAILRSAGEMLSRSEVTREIDSVTWTPLKTVLEQYKTQILVDEATDFSPIQLACMYSLAHPRSRSFFACGDFNQRLTAWGTRSASEISWICRDMESKEVNITYRQSRQLNDLAQAIIELTGGSRLEISLPPDVDCEGVSPVLLEKPRSRSAEISWLAQRITEIEGLVRQLPSIAIFVPSEAEVEPVAKDLNKALTAQNLRVVPCPNGRVVGQQNEIRVFDVQHIKGLEFEAVFFFHLDRLAEEKGELFPRYLYVGSTRAATYLGITCEGLMPAILRPTRNMFSSEWKS